jgi:hypothetical protein
MKNVVGDVNGEVPVIEWRAQNEASHQVYEFRRHLKDPQINKALKR